MVLWDKQIWDGLRHKNKTNGRSSKSDPTSVQDGEAGFLSRPDLRRGSEQSLRRDF